MDGSLSQIKGDHNLWFGVGAGPVQTANNLNVDPLFVNRSSGDLHLSSSSPAKDAGLTVVPSNPFFPNPGTNQVRDKDGTLRPQGNAFDLGAYELLAGGGTVPTPPNAPTGVSVVVH